MKISKAAIKFFVDKHCTRVQGDFIMIFFLILLFDYPGSITNVNYFSFSGFKVVV